MHREVFRQEPLGDCAPSLTRSFWRPVSHTARCCPERTSVGFIPSATRRTISEARMSSVILKQNSGSRVEASATPRVIVTMFIVFIVGLYTILYFTSPNLPDPSVPHSGWATWWDQGKYLEAAAAWANWDLNSNLHWYFPGYALLTAPFYLLMPSHPFFLPDAVLLAIFIVLFFGNYPFYIVGTSGRCLTDRPARIPHQENAAIILFATSAKYKMVPWTGLRNVIPGSAHATAGKNLISSFCRPLSMNPITVS